MMVPAQACKMLIDTGEDVDEVGHIGLTPLTAATFEANLDIVNLLLEAGADPNLPTRTGSTPLIKSTCYLRSHQEHKRHQVTAMLLRANADPNHRVNKVGVTLFIVMCVMFILNIRFLLLGDQG